MRITEHKIHMHINNRLVDPPSKLSGRYHFLSRCSSFDLSLPKNPLDRFDFLSVPAAELAAVDLVGVEPEATPLVTLGPPLGRDMGDTSRESSLGLA